MSDLDQVEWTYPLIIVQYDDPTSAEPTIQPLSANQPARRDRPRLAA